jgi:hypothetical protein
MKTDSYRLEYPSNARPLLTGITLVEEVLKDTTRESMSAWFGVPVL